MLINMCEICMLFAHTYKDVEDNFQKKSYQSCFPLLISLFLPIPLNPPPGAGPAFPF